MRRAFQALPMEPARRGTGSAIMTRFGPAPPAAPN